MPAMPRKLHNSLLALSIVGLLLAGGFLISRPVATAPVPAFAAASAADIDAGRVQFVHDGSSDRWASFEVVVVDGAGAASGAAQTVKVAVLPK